jgi:4-amino-4-deoxy-L-arabinose transferase-like glycosyltransferase
MWSNIKKIDKFLDRHVHLCLLLLILVILRIPNFFEPYWYGDEGIYLTLGQAMRSGERLYLEIIDHKTPLIYYLAMVPNQLWFRALLLVSTIVSSICFYYLAKKLFRSTFSRTLATLAFILLTTLPAFEGNIPNGELFVMTFILLGGVFFSHTPLFKNFFSESEKETAKRTTLFSKIFAHPNINLLLSGILFSLGILTKVPAIFDAFGFMSIGWFVLVDQLWQFPKHTKQSLLHIKDVILAMVQVGVGVAIPIALSIVYFVLRGSGKAYLDYGLLYNFRYAGSWQLNFSWPFLNTLFTLPVKAAIAGGIILLLSLFSKKFTAQFRFIMSWFLLALFASLLSNRPYPHYFLQMFPSLCLLIGYLIQQCIEMANKKRFAFRIVEILMSLGGVALMISVLLLLNAGLYPTVSYYTRFFNLVTHRISEEEYRNSFDSLMADNYRAKPLLDESSNKFLLIWGTNPMLYALSGKNPPGRFTVLFHIRDFNAEHETFEATVAKKPDFIVVMKDEQVPAELNNYIHQNYIPNTSFSHFTLWRTQGK